MKEKIRTDGLVIRERHTGESDPHNHRAYERGGSYTGLCHRSKKNNRKIGVLTGLLCFSDFVFSPSRDSFRVSEASPKEVFFGLRDSLEKLSLAQYFCELAGVLCPSDEPAEDFLRLMLNCLKFLEEERLPENQIKAIFEMQMMRLSGYRPDLSGCGICGREENLFFDMHEARYFVPSTKRAGKAAFAGTFFRLCGLFPTTA